MGDLQSRIDITIIEVETADRSHGLYSDSEAKACPMKLPLFSGLISEDFVGFKDNFLKAAFDNKITRKDQVDKLRECLLAQARATDATNNTAASSNVSSHMTNTSTTATPAPKR